MESFTEFDVLWIQSTPAIAAIFYHKYLQVTSSLYCPYSEEPITIRQTFRRIQNAMLTVSFFFKKISLNNNKLKQI